MTGARAVLPVQVQISLEVAEQLEPAIVVGWSHGRSGRPRGVRW